MSEFEDATRDAESSFTADPVGSTVEQCKSAGDESTTKNDNEIDIVFDPDKSKKVKECDRIVHIQFMRYYADGKIVNGADYSSAYEHKRAITTDKGWVVDCLSGENSPDYQQGTGDGSKNGGSSKATMWDAPQTGGGDKGFYDKVGNPTGWKTIRFEFATFAWCMEGSECGHWYEGVTWQYQKSYKEEKAGKKGKAKLTKKNVSSSPSKDQIAAFDKFNSERGFSPCP